MSSPVLDDYDADTEVDGEEEEVLQQRRPAIEITTPPRIYELPFEWSGDHHSGDWVRLHLHTEGVRRCYMPKAIALMSPVLRRQILGRNPRIDLRRPKMTLEDALTLVSYYHSTENGRRRLCAEQPVWALRFEFVQSATPAAGDASVAIAGIRNRYSGKRSFYHHSDGDGGKRPSLVIRHHTLSL
ncbi:hypothetical protein QKT49_gp331 [Acanthamoeba castellanii medusavirus]|uniref:Uncharacterized protein n=1 Tax=Acanthamoeba castellanii medusavirus J1 TaxID=3114988 RepID=A0A3T1CX66_9VIRU|nr:hypothetical protein QKT49_gp331 [Acanthamoeba castellanii medusavirus]BBI30432.1 hypothetical protein [Acanthamoeba castellanii medusavirus J1]